MLALLVATSPSSGQTFDAGLIPPFHPSLTLNSDPAVCTPFLRAWTDVFDSDATLTEDRIDLGAAYPKARLWTFPPKGAGGMYNTSFSLSIDFDGDGDREVLHVDSRDVGWRYLGVDLFLFESEDDYAAAQESNDHKQYGYLDLNSRSEPVSNAEYGLLYAYDRAGAIHILQHDGNVYTVAIPKPPTETQATTASLVLLNALRGPEPVCAVELMPPKSAVASFRDHSQLFAGLRDVYGGPQGCQGAMGWTVGPIDATLPELFYRPQTFDQKSSEGSADKVRRDDALREIRYLVWAVSDPQSWRDYLDVKNGRAAFLAGMKSYYLARFAQSPDEASLMAERAWRVLLDSVVYARNPDGYSLTQVAWRNDAALPIGPDTPPEEIARVTVEAWISASKNPDGWVGVNREDVWTQALLAAIHSRQPVELIRTLVAERDRVIDDLIEQAAGKNENWTAELAGQRANRMDAPLLAALGDDALTEAFLEMGANPNAATNWFKKTPLMYAAQHKQMNSVRLLLSRGADINAVTDGSGRPCASLQRDHRTALMYAAENASAQMIEYLLDAGADAAANDTEGNTALWYFERNKAVLDPEVRARLAVRLAR